MVSAAHAVSNFRPLVDQTIPSRFYLSSLMYKILCPHGYNIAAKPAKAHISAPNPGKCRGLAFFVAEGAILELAVLVSLVWLVAVVGEVVVPVRLEELATLAALADEDPVEDAIDEVQDTADGRLVTPAVLHMLNAN